MSTDVYCSPAPHLPTSESTLASSGPRRTAAAAAAGRSREESWTDRRRSTTRLTHRSATSRHTGSIDAGVLNVRSAHHKAALIHEVFRDNRSCDVLCFIKTTFC